MKPLHTVVSRDSNSAVHSYLVELRKIAIHFQSLSCATSARFKEAEILVGSRHLERQGFDEVMDHIGDDETDPDLEYVLLAPNQVAIADDVIAYRQFGGAIFCAPQETILEGENNRACTSIMQTLETQVSTDPLAVNDLATSFKRYTKGQGRHL